MDAGHDSGVEKHDNDRSDNEKIHSHRNGQDDDQSGQGAHYDECNANVAGRQSELDGQHNDLGTLSLGEGHNCDRDRPLFSDDSFNCENCGRLFKFYLPSPSESSDINEGGTSPWPSYGSSRNM